MGRPWWYDDYWKKEQKPEKRRFRSPKKPFWIWIVILALSLLLAANSTGFQPVVLVWIAAFIHYLCRILVIVIFVRALLSWFTIDRNNIIVVLLDAVAEPVLSPLRRIVPKIGQFDLSPLVAIVILYLISFIFSRILL